jgi:hemoglobin
LKADIHNSDDVKLMVTTFYNNLLLNEEIKPLFDGIDFEHHMPRMIAFWEFVLLDKEGYTTNVFDKHVHLPLSANHFSIWLSVFEKTVNSLFEGENAQKAIFRAKTIAFSFESKLKQMGRIG